jgi:hypothetical protein
MAELSKKTEDAAGEKIQEAGDKIRERRETIGQQVDQGVLDARKKGSELSEFMKEMLRRF